MNPRAPVNPRTLLTWLGLGFGVAGLLLQFIISIPSYLANGRDVFGALGMFFSYYTILTNIVLVLIYMSVVLKSPRLEFFRRPWVRAMMAANIALVALYVFFVLRHLSQLDGLFELADRLLHYICPALYLLWWVVAQKHGQLRWSNLPIMLAPTVLYLAYAMARGLWVQEYPYPILNAVKLGYGQVALNVMYMALALTALTAIVIALDRMLVGREVQIA